MRSSLPSEAMGQTSSRKVRSTFRDYTTTPWPPRRGSPAASRLPSSSSSTAAAPPDGSGLATTAHRIEVVLTEHVVEVDAGTGHDHPRAGAVRGGQRGGVARRVDGRDVSRPGSAGRLGPAGLAGLDPRCRCIDVGEEPAGEAAAVEVACEAAPAGTGLLAHHLGQARD